jgi:MFS family permease
LPAARAAAPRNEILAQAGPIFASMLGLACGVATLGLPYSIGVFVKPLQAQFGWTFTQIFLVQPIVTVAVVFMAALVGWIVDRYGARRAIVVSQVGFGLGLMAIGAFTRSLTSFYVLYFLMALAAGGTLAITFTKLLSSRFDRQRGLALGLALSGTGVCSFLFQPFLAWVVANYDWRTGYFAIGLLPICLALPATLRWLHDAPRGAPVAQSAHADAGHEPAAADPGLALAEVLRGWRFWALALVFLLFSGAITGVLNNFVPILMEKGYDAVRAAEIAGTFGLAVIVGRIGIGALIDRYWAPMVGFCFFIPSAIGMALLAGPPPGTALTILFVALAGLAAGAEVDLMAYLVSRYFGLRDFGKIYAGIYIGFALGPGVLVPAFAWLRDATGDYSVGLLGVAVAMVLSALVLLTMGRYPRPG